MDVQIDDKVATGVGIAVTGGGLMAAIFASWRFTIGLIGIPKRVSHLERMQVVVLGSLRALIHSNSILIQVHANEESAELMASREELSVAHDSLNKLIDTMATGGSK